MPTDAEMRRVRDERKLLEEWVFEALESGPLRFPEIMTRVKALADVFRKENNRLVWAPMAISTADGFELAVRQILVGHPRAHPIELADDLDDVLWGDYRELRQEFPSTRTRWERVLGDDLDD